MSITDDLLAIVESVAAVIELPAVEQLVLPEKMLSLSEANAKHDKFGFLSLSGRKPACGFFYRLLSVDQQLQNEQQEYLRQLASMAVGKNALEVASWLTANDDFTRSIGLAAVNAITQHIYQLTDFTPPLRRAKQASETQLLERSERVGMVGYFHRQVENLRRDKKTVFVLELDQSLYQHSDQLIVSADAQQLKTCEPIFCTGSTLINGSLDELLELAGHQHFELIGPSAGCFPDVLFSRGVDLIGGSRVVNPTDTASRVANGDPWHDAVAKFQLSPEDYPGVEELLTRIK